MQDASYDLQVYRRTAQAHTGRERERGRLIPAVQERGLCPGVCDRVGTVLDVFFARDLREWNFVLGPLALLLLLPKPIAATSGCQRRP